MLQFLLGLRKWWWKTLISFMSMKGIFQGLAPCHEATMSPERSGLRTHCNKKLRTIHFWILFLFFLCKVHRKTVVKTHRNIQATRIAVSRVHPIVDRCPVCLRHTCCRNRLDPQMLPTRCWFDRISTVQQLDARDECTTVFPMVFFTIFSLLDTGWCVCFLLRPTVSILSNF